MLPIGKMNRLIEIQEPTTALDDMGGSVRTWGVYATAWAAVENEEYSSAESNAAPHERGVMTRTYIVRNHPSLDFNNKMRVNDPTDNVLGAITAIRYDAKRTVCFVDVVSGAANG